MKKKLLLLILAMLLVVFSAIAFSACDEEETPGDGDNNETEDNPTAESDDECNGTNSTATFTYTINADGTGYIVDGTTAIIKNDVIVPSKINGLPVTEIGANFLANKATINSVKIPDTVVTINGSYGLTIPGAFYGCTGLTSVTIPDSIEIIGDNAFAGCTSLIYNEKDGIKYLGNKTNPYIVVMGANESTTSVILPNTVKIVYGNPFYSCTKLESISVDVDNIVFSSQDGILFKKTNSRIIYIPQNLKGAITIPEGITYITSSMFGGNIGLTNITIPNSVTNIDNNAFKGCAGLESVTIGSCVTNIGDNAFKGCTKLTEINFNATAMNDLSSNNAVFYDAGQNGSGITVNIGANVTKIPAYLFNPNNSSLYYPKITNVKFADNSQCKSIGAAAFNRCAELTSITLPDSVTTIVGDAFGYCSGLTSITIPDSVTSIGGWVFTSCTKLESVTIGTSVTSIGSAVFNNCTKLTSITFLDTSIWYYTDSKSNWENKIGGSKIDVTNPSNNAIYLNSTYYNYYWYKK